VCVCVCVCVDWTPVFAKEPLTDSVNTTTNFWLPPEIFDQLGHYHRLLKKFTLCTSVLNYFRGRTAV